MKPARITCVCLLVFCLFGTASWAQTVKRMTVEETLAFVNPKSPTFINGTEAEQMRSIPHKIIGNLYYVGSETLSSFLVVTPEGNILINSTFERNVPLIQQAVEQLGFNFKDTKILTTSHGHADHVEGDAMVKQMTGAEVVMMAEDVDPVRKIMPGGKPHPIDQIIHDRDQITLGGTTLVAYLTPAHTPGCTTWTMQVPEAGKTYSVVIQGCGIGTGRLVDQDGKVMKEVDQTIGSFKLLRSLPCDIFLAAHGRQYNLKAKYDNVGKGSNPFIDSEGYNTALDNWETYFIENLGRQIATAAAKK